MGDPNSLTSKFPESGELCMWLCSHLRVTMCCSRTTSPSFTGMPCRHAGFL